MRPDFKLLTDFLSTWGERSTVQRLILVGSGMGPETLARSSLAVSMISTADWSSSRCRTLLIVS